MVDKAKVKEAIRLLLEGIGEDPERDLKIHRTASHVCVQKSMAALTKKLISIC